MPDHTGRRRPSRRAIGQIAVLAGSLAAVALFVTVSPPRRAAVVQPPFVVVAPTWIGPAASTTPGRLADGTPYTPRLFFDPQTSVGVAPSTDGRALRLVLCSGARVTELRRLAVTSQPSFDAFVAAGDQLVWAESADQPGTAGRTSLWRVNWRTPGKAATVTSTMGDPVFAGGQYDLVAHANRIYWASGTAPAELRSVPVTGGTVASTRLGTGFVLSAWPWAVSADGGRGRPVRLLNYSTGASSQLSTAAAETATCGPTWCRIGVLGDGSLTRLDLVHADGTGRRRIAGTEATPTTVDATLLDRYVPLATDRGADGVGLSVYDATTGQTSLIAVDAASVGASGALLWWSSGTGTGLTWYSIDLGALA